MTTHNEKGVATCALLRYVQAELIPGKAVPSRASLNLPSGSLGTVSFALHTLHAYRIPRHRLIAVPAKVTIHAFPGTFSSGAAILFLLSRRKLLYRRYGSKEKTRIKYGLIEAQVVGVHLNWKINKAEERKIDFQGRIMCADREIECRPSPVERKQELKAGRTKSI
jgi:hypothetical protein